MRLICIVKFGIDARCAFILAKNECAVGTVLNIFREPVEKRTRLYDFASYDLWMVNETNLKRIARNIARWAGAHAHMHLHFPSQFHELLKNEQEQRRASRIFLESSPSRTNCLFISIFGNQYENECGTSICAH